MKATLAQVLAQVLAEDRGRILSALIARFRDFDLAEESLSEAAESALIHWRRSGLPENPRAWLMTVARRKALDRLRKSRRQAQGAQVLSLLADERAGTETPEIPDERLRLIFTCCHPALAPKSRVALTLRMLGGLTTTEIARAFRVLVGAFGRQRTETLLREPGIRQDSRRDGVRAVGRIEPERLLEVAAAGVTLVGMVQPDGQFLPEGQVMDPLDQPDPAVGAVIDMDEGLRSGDLGHGKLAVKGDGRIAVPV